MLSRELKCCCCSAGPVILRKVSWAPDLLVMEGAGGGLESADYLDLAVVPGVVLHHDPGQHGVQGGGHWPSRGKRSGQRKGWNKYLLRSLREGIKRSGRMSYFGRGHMMRSGK